jgi:3-deoxy-D-manno-octulosonic-acid transferase
MSFVVNLLYLLAGAAISPLVVYRAVRYKRYRTGWAHRLGKITRRSPHNKCIWLHAVSVGEINAAQTIVTELQKRFSDFEIVVSTTTDTGFARASALFGKDLQVFYFPLDFSWIMRRAFRRIQPTLCLLMELEVWPNFMQIAQRLSIPVVVLNGRISDKSFAGYKKIKLFVKKMFRKLTLVLAQTHEYADRFKALGCPDEKVIVTGSLKYDTAQITDKVEGADVLAEQLFGKFEIPLWVAGATGPGEEEIILDVYKQLKLQDPSSDLRLVIVPRKPERFDEVAKLIEQAGFELIRYSQVKSQTTGQSNIEHRTSSIESVILGDTMGDLRKFYSLARIIFVGRSLVPMGGSDMMEAAALGKCTVFGPHAFNFKHTVDALLANGGAIMVKDKKELLQVMRRCLGEPAFAQEIARNGQQIIRKNQGATTRSMEQISRIIGPA